MRAMALLRAALAGDGPSDHERAELLGALAFAARMTEEQVDRLALTQEALGLLADDAPVQLRVFLLARRAEALMDDGASADALVVADEAMALAVEHDLTVDRTDLASILARLSESRGRPRGVDPAARGCRRRVDQRPRPRAAARDAHPRVGALPPG